MASTSKRFYSFGLLLAIFCFAVSPAAPVQAIGAVRYAVPSGLTSGTCGSWAAACSLPFALSVAVSGDEIWVQSGVHVPGTTRASTFTLKNGVAVYGGFTGSETLRSQRNPQAYVTILSGDIDQNDVNVDGNGIAETPADIVGANAYHVVTCTNLHATVLDGFTITAGQTDTLPDNDSGAGMTMWNSSITINNVTFQGNLAQARGGGLAMQNGSPTLSSVAFINNQASAASSAGGGLSNEGGSPSLMQVIFSGNQAAHGGGMANVQLVSGLPVLNGVTFNANIADEGGGMYNSAISPILVSVVFYGNTAAVAGGGLFNTNSHPTLVTVVFNANFATIGGGMVNNASAPVLNDAIFKGNAASGSGGGIYNLNSSPALTNIRFLGNTASSGGGLSNTASSNPAVINAIFSGNQADYGGAIHNLDGSPTLTNVTLSGNQASFSGGGMHNTDSFPLLRNSILWGNTAGAGAQISNTSSNPNITFCDIQDSHASGASWDAALGTDGGNNIDQNPRLVDADGADNLAGTGDDDLHLQVRSPAFDAGSSALVPAAVTSDLDGLPRIFNDSVDLGAYELQSLGHAIFLPVTLR